MRGVARLCMPMEEERRLAFAGCAARTAAGREGRAAPGRAPATREEAAGREPAAYGETCEPEPVGRDTRRALEGAASLEKWEPRRRLWESAIGDLPNCAGGRVDYLSHDPRESSQACRKRDAAIMSTLPRICFSLRPCSRRILFASELERRSSANSSGRSQASAMERA